MSDAYGAAYGAMDGQRQACHDIRQPIAGVLALAGAALAEAGLPDNARSRLEQIVGLAEWQSEVIEDWLQASRPGRPGAGQADVVGVVNQALAAERVTFAGELIFQWPAEPVFAPLHPVILRRVVANLLANATGAAGHSGRVRVEVGCRAGWMVVVVEDSGPGFGRLSAGSGLGLHAAARQATRHHGRLECGRGRHGGGQVSLWLPLAPAQTGGRAAHATRSV
jgi:signal transduction histidine kinase